MIPASVEYLRAASIDEALDALADPEAKALAGGHSLVPMMKLRLAAPSLLVDIGGLDFRGLSHAGDVVSIGALTTYDELLRLGAAVLPAALRESSAAVGDVQVRNMGTIGGSLAHGDPASDAAAAVLALGCTLRLQSASGVREFPAAEFFASPFETALEQQELLTEIALPVLGPSAGSAYRAIEDPASGYPLAGAAVRVRLDGDRVSDCAVGLTGAASVPCRLPSVEAALTGASTSSGDGPAGDAALGEAVREAMTEVQLSLGSGSSEYRRHLAVVAIRRAFQAARSRAEKGDER
jgi:carbon-monoxide dehydrogenase medium subunit